MGLFDYVRVSDPRFVCSEGHDLSDCEFQSHDFGEMMGTVVIDDGRVSTKAVCLGEPEADSNRVEIYGTCVDCPAFVQFGTGNLVGCSVTFEVELDGDAVVSITRTSRPTPEWLTAELQSQHMRRCEGPMPYADAASLHADYSRFRPDHRAEFEAWSEARSKAMRSRKPWPWDLAVGEYPDGAL